MKPKAAEDNEEEILNPDSICLFDDDSSEDQSVLCTKGQKSDAFFLVLQGKVVIESGAEGFILQLSTFSYFGLDSLLNDGYVPDFSARVSKYARLLKITRIDYMKAISSYENINS